MRSELLLKKIWFTQIAPEWFSLGIGRILPPVLANTESLSMLEVRQLLFSISAFFIILHI
jgi:hypothetical protein